MKAEDLTYRLQVLVKKSVKHASRCRRKELQSDDLDHILEEFGEAPFLAAHEPEYGVVNYEGSALHYHLPQSIDLSELSLEEDNRPEMQFSSFSMEKFAILVDGKPTAKFLKKQPKVFQHKSRYYPGHWDLYLIHLTHGLGDEYEDERVAFFAKDFESNPHLNEILPQLRFIFQQCSMCSVAERQLRLLQMLRGLLLNPFVDVARLGNVRPILS